MTRINRAATLQPAFIPFLLVAWEQEACCCLRLELDQDRNQPGFYLSVLSSPCQSSIPPSSNLFF